MVIFAGGKFLENVRQTYITRGCKFCNTSAISIAVYKGCYFCVGVIFGINAKSQKNEKITPTRKFSRLQYISNTSTNSLKFAGMLLVLLVSHKMDLILKQVLTELKLTVQIFVCTLCRYLRSSDILFNEHHMYIILVVSAC